jgi:hypothetical protein
MICQFGLCTCPIEHDTHCGPTCRLGIDEKSEPCKCGHAGGGATIGEAPVKP